jgi:hypothetical protein
MYLLGFRVPPARYWEAVDGIASLRDAPIGHVRPTERTYHATTSPVQEKQGRMELDPSFGEVYGLEDPFEHFAAAESLRHPLGAPGLSFSADMQAALDGIVRLEVATPAERLRRLGCLRGIAASIRDLSVQVNERAEHHVRDAAGPDGHPVFVAALIDAFGWPDDEFPSDYSAAGFPSRARSGRAAQVSGASKTQTTWPPSASTSYPRPTCTQPTPSGTTGWRPSSDGVTSRPSDGESAAT